MRSAKLDKYESCFEKLEFLFKVLFLLYTMVGYNGFLIGNKIISFIMWPMFMIGLVMILWRCINIKRYINVPGFWGMLFFGISFAISMVLNYRYELKQNVITMIFLAFYFVILYLQDKNKMFVEKEFMFMGAFYLIYMTISVVWSLVLFFMRFGMVRHINEDSYELVTGFVWGRLWGVFLDPNVGAILACVAVVIGMFFLKRSKKKFFKILYGLIICLQILYIAFSDSRTGMLCFGCLVAMEIYCNVYRKIRGYRKGKIVLLLCVCIIFAGAGFSLPKAITKVYNCTVDVLEEGILDNTMLVTRGYDLSVDPSNRRFDIWKSGIEIFEENYVFGTSYNGIRPYAYEYLPETYIVNNDSTDFRNLHNEFLNVLVSQGIVGFFAMILMIVPIVVLVVKKIFSSDEDRIVEDALFCGISVITLGTMFTSAGFFYYVCPYTVIFWMMLGYLQYYLRKEAS